MVAGTHAAEYDCEDCQNAQLVVLTRIDIDHKGIYGTQRRSEPRGFRVYQGPHASKEAMKYVEQHGGMVSFTHEYHLETGLKIQDAFCSSDSDVNHGD